MDLPTRQPSCACPSTRRPPRPAARSLTPSRRATDVSRAACASRRGARIGRYAASIAPLPATCRRHAPVPLSTLGGRTGTAFEDETTGRCRTRGARAGGARVDRRRGAQHGAARPRAVRALERLALPRDLLVVVVVARLGRSAHAARVETGGRRRALDRRWHRTAERAARARRCCTRRCTSRSPPRRRASPTSTCCRRWQTPGVF